MFEQVHEPTETRSENAPRHPKARHFQGLGLVNGVRNFTEFEARVTSLPTEQARGAAFEVFAEACLATQRIYQAREVWPGNSTPSTLRQQLRLPSIDMGVDGVFVTAAGDPVCYQSKFRIGRPALTWTELSTFYGLADASTGKLVFTNCDEVARVAEERSGAIFVRGSDLDRLTRDDFRIIEAWLAGQPTEAKKKEPKPHQLAALKDIVAGLSRGPRATALMACGSGKTLVALWAAERLRARTVLVLLPSLALVRQTLHEWLHETAWPDVQFLCVCSDPTVRPEDDSLLVRPSDLDFAVTTKSADVRHFLERPTESVRLIFSTYQSSRVVADAIAGLPPFDLGVFDEAHKTAGREGAKFALALKDEHVPVARRLFLTATPRHYDIATKNKSGDSRIVFSMDVPEVYGPVVHRLPFSAATKAGIITDYQVIISVVSSEMVTDEVLKRGVVLVEGDEVKARQVANQIALKSAIDKFGVSKVFTFHSRVNAAKSFVSGGPEGVGTHIAGFACTYIEGVMSTAYREKLLREFEATPQAILSNARCLTEGVDVPAVDMVAFLSPKRSLVDIVQAAGRAMRLSPATGKKRGYVLVPLYVEKARGETIEQAVLRSNFDEVWKVLQGLKEQDDLLAQIIADMRIERGRTGGYDDSRFRERVEVLGPELSLETLRRAISAACLDAVGEGWFERYGQLLAYHQKHGHCDVPYRWQENQFLGTWVVNQRVLQRGGTLEPEKAELLSRIGFKWNPFLSAWRANYLELLDFRRRFGHCRVPQRWRENRKLASFVQTQRHDYSKGNIERDHIALLEKIGFEWRTGLGTWDQRFDELCAYKDRFGNTLVPVKWAENRLLGGWVSAQRCRYRAGKLRKEYADRLSSIGFELNAPTTKFQPRAPRQTVAVAKPKVSAFTWDEMFASLVGFFRLHGHCNVPAKWTAAPALPQWINQQRRAKRENYLTPEQRTRLEEVGFTWTGVDSDWDKMFMRLVDHLRPMHNGKPRNVVVSGELSRWMLTQRQARKRGELVPERERRLDSIGFDWEPLSSRWNQMFRELRQYQSEHGHCRVPMGWSENPALGKWVAVQRARKLKGVLTPERADALESLGFTWRVTERSGHSSNEAWNAMLDRLAAFRAEQGHSVVPQRYMPDRRLGVWVMLQRRSFRLGRLTEQQVTSLNELSFQWEVSVNHSRLGFQASPCNRSDRVSADQEWEVMLGALKEYKQAHGSCLVPQRWVGNRALAEWVSNQRSAYRRNLLDPERAKRLDELGFTWDPVSTWWENKFQQLLEFKRKYGHTNVPQQSPTYPELATWVHNQRHAKRNNRPIMADREKRLDEIGFVWCLVEPNVWEQMFERLLKFKKAHGHCNVPQKGGTDRKLGRWVNVQRLFHMRGKIRPERRKQLEVVGFVWNMKKPAIKQTGQLDLRLG